MYVARILYPVKVLGPGNRIGIWFCGCPRRCEGCSNPELWEFQDRYKTSLATVMSLIEKIAQVHSVDGFTITGGDPFFQPDALSRLLEQIKKISDDILVYTGYMKNDLPVSLLKNISVLIDAPYIKARNNNCCLRGSGNQNIYVLNGKYRAVYENYLSATENQIQNFMTQDGIISVGIHRPDFIF